MIKDLFYIFAMTFAVFLLVVYSVLIDNDVNKQQKKIEALELEQLMLYSKLEELEAKIYIEVK